MATKLPQTTSKLIWPTCQRLEFFSQHQIVSEKQLTFGSCSQTYQVQTNQGDFLVRHAPSSLSSVARAQEVLVQSAAAALGLAPAVLYTDEKESCVVSEFLLASRELSKTEGQAESEAVAKLLQVFHQKLTVTDGCFQSILHPKEYVASLVAKLPSSFLQCQENALLYQKLHSCAALWQQEEAHLAWCHFDLHPGNLLKAKGRLWLIDFEYSQRADVCFDLASFSWNFALKEVHERQFLRVYCKLRDWTFDADFLQKYQRAKVLTLGFAWLWYVFEAKENKDPRHAQAVLAVKEQLEQLA